MSRRQARLATGEGGGPLSVRARGGVGGDVVGRRGGWALPARGRARGRAAVAHRPAFLAGVAQVAAALRSGAPPDVAWRRGLDIAAHDGLPDGAELLDRAGDPRQAAAVLAVARLARDLGAAPAAVLDALVVALVRDAEAAAGRAAALAGPRATARLLGWLPVLGIALGLAVGADPLPVLLDGGAGTALLVAGGVASLAGHRWTGLLLHRARTAGAEP
ncbi:hypothetical protein [Actinotalea sp.]|uniref:hypothetical protein n=1 Tax=Actinotalea sp. TaxID=1872145 RepID=UPI002C5EC1F1|nr:hypothetical protein [Actinotalea sp.]HRA50267.1 hypothetical protein [Actinotalea sp.]